MFCLMTARDLLFDWRFAAHTLCKAGDQPSLSRTLFPAPPEHPESTPVPQSSNDKQDTGAAVGELARPKVATELREGDIERIHARGGFRAPALPSRSRWRDHQIVSVRGYVLRGGWRFTAVLR